MGSYYPHLREMHEQLCEEHDELIREHEALKEELEETRDALGRVFGVLTLAEAERVFQEHPDIREFLR